MVIEVSKNVTQSPCNVDGKKYSREELQSIIMKLMQDTGVGTDSTSLGENGVLKVDENANLKLQSLILKAEEMGLEVRFTKKTFIEFC